MESIEMDEGELVNENLAATRTEVVQIIMQDNGQAMLPNGELIQLDSQEHMQLLQVTNENGENQLLQVSSDGTAHVVELSNLATVDDSNYLQVSAQPPDQLTTEDPSVLTLHNSQEEIEMDTHVEASIAQNELCSQTESLEESALTAEASTVSLNDVGVEPIPDTTEKENLQNQETDKPESEKGSDKKEEGKNSLDLNCPIELTSETEVLIGGKKCVLRVDPSTNHLVAFPVKPDLITPGKRPRGRPRKVIKDEPRDENGDFENVVTKKIKLEPSTKVPKPSIAPSEQENSAAEGLLGLSECDGKRKSLRVKKKPRLLQDLYETGKIEGVEDVEDAGSHADVELDPDVSMAAVSISTSSAAEEIQLTPQTEKRGRGRPSKSLSTSNQVQNFLANLGLPVKRGRGRPRRYPPKDGHGLNQLSAFIIPSPSGQTMVMGTMEDSKQFTSSNPVMILPKQSKESTLPGSSTIPVTAQTAIGAQNSIIIQAPDGTETEVVPPQNVTDTMTWSFTMGDKKDEDSVVTVSQENDIQLVQREASEDTRDGNDDTQHEHDDIVTSEDVANESGGDKENLTEDSETAAAVAILEGEGEEEGMPKGPIIQLPQHLIPFLMSVKNTEPIKIGMKVTEGELEKLKCPKCDFQAYYQQQFQEHIGKAHEEEVHKCKCCLFRSFSLDELLEHFRDIHPRCICNICDFMAEHAYVIKRHMMRHNAKGSECEVCGKSYKDQYILKMHIKMVHMPAEVLFECNICSKKFTRKAHLKRHLRIHDPNKPFKCPHCDYRGCERSDITKHLLIHQEPQHSCEVCGKAFRHIKNKELHVKRHRGQRDYKCGMCDFYGYTFTDIRKHIDRKHTDVRHIMCDKCGRSFHNDMMLREHQLKSCELLMTVDPNLVEHSEEEDIEPILVAPDDGSHLTDPSHILVDQSHISTITVEQMPMTNQMTGVQVSEASLSEAQLVEQQICVSQGQVIDPNDLSQHQVISISGQVTETGEVVDEDGNVISPEMLREHGHIIHIAGDTNGHVITMEDITHSHAAGQVLDESGQVIDESGQVIDESGQVIDESGQVIDESGQVIDESGQVIDESGQVIHESGQVLHESGQVIDESGQVLDESGQVIDESGQVIDESGQVLMMTDDVRTGMLQMVEGDQCAVVGEVEMDDGEDNESHVEQEGISIDLPTSQ